MDLVTIKENNLEYFRNMMTKEISLMMNDKTCLFVGAVDENTAVGVAAIRLNLYEDDNGNAEIIWIYVPEEKRHKGIGTFLIDSLISYIGKIGITTLFAITDESSSDSFSLFMSERRDARKEKLGNSAFRILAKDLSQKLEEMKIEGHGCTKLSEYSMGAVSKMIQKLPESDQSKLELFYSNIDSSKKYLDYSVVYSESSLPKGICMVEMESEADYTLDLIINKSKDAAAPLNMLSFAALEILANEKDAMLTIITTDNFGQIVKKIAGDKGEDVSIGAIVIDL